MAVRKLRSSWWVDFRWRGERHRTRSPLNTRSGAQEFEVTLRRHLVAHGALDAFDHGRQAVPTLAAFSERWMRDHVAVHNRPKEQAQKRCILRAHLLPAFGKTPLDRIDNASIDAFVARATSMKLSAKTINNHLAALRRCLTCARDWNVIANVPRIRMLRVMPPEFRCLDEREERALLAAAGTDLFGAMMLFALRTGARYSELTALRWSDVSLRDRSIVIRRSVVDGVEGPTKNGRLRHVPLSDDVARVLTARRRGAGLVFTLDGGFINYDIAWRRLASIARRAVIAPVMWHDLRHTFASRLVARSAPLPAVQQLLGHASIQTTMRYTHLARSTLSSVVALLTAPAGLENWATGGQRGAWNAAPQAVEVDAERAILG